MRHQQDLSQHEHRLDLVTLLLHIVLQLRDALSQLQGLQWGGEGVARDVHKGHAQCVTRTGSTAMQSATEHHFHLV